MADDRIAKNMRAFMEAIKNHAAKFPSHKPYGIAIGAFDAERLGIDHGEEIVPGMIIEVEAGRQSGTFRVLCDSDGDVHLAIPCQAGTAAVSGKFVLNTLAIVSGSPVEVVSATIG